MNEGKKGQNEQSDAIVIRRVAANGKVPFFCGGDDVIVERRRGGEREKERKNDSEGEQRRDGV